MNRAIKYIFRFIGCGLIVISIYVGALFTFCETVFAPNPEIDTQFASQFSKEIFESLSVGASTSKVEELLGSPFTKHGGSEGCWDGKDIDLPSTTNNLPLSIATEVALPPEGTEVWSYSKRGTFKWFKFAWLEYRVQFRGGKLQKIEKCWQAA